ncbi:hypothetical protein PAECIP111892_01777 [Paenibacillus auburnensis]|uniref:Uncharacterized protein n=1 Tax=Paenibacillus auburnensis TaxID=2905649 RepID=A0ABM9BTN6_9BACL|nr:hypothetical protein PAECIP111892_01777 [Paenibacillus auburnensis]
MTAETFGLGANYLHGWPGAWPFGIFWNGEKGTHYLRTLRLLQLEPFERLVDLVLTDAYVTLRYGWRRVIEYLL